jgi:hypothetical protein
MGFLGRGISCRKAATCTRKLNHRINVERHPCLEWDSNPRPHCSSGRRRCYLFIFTKCIASCEIVYLDMKILLSLVDFKTWYFSIFELRRHFPLVKYLHHFMTDTLSWELGVSHSFIHSFINDYSPVLGPGSSLVFYTDGWTPWTSDQLAARPLPTQRTTQTQNKRIHRHPCLEWDSNLQSQRSSERRQFMP